MALSITCCLVAPIRNTVAFMTGDVQLRVLRPTIRRVVANSIVTMGHVKCWTYCYVCVCRREEEGRREGGIKKIKSAFWKRNINNSGANEENIYIKITYTNINMNSLEQATPASSECWQLCFNMPL